MSVTMFVIPIVALPATGVSAAAVPVTSSVLVGANLTAATSVLSVTTVAAPVALTVIGLLAAGFVLEEKNFQRHYKCESAEFPTMFSDQATLIQLLKKYKCPIEVFENGNLRIVIGLQTYLFAKDGESGFYRLLIDDVVSREELLAQVNGLMEAYKTELQAHTAKKLKDCIADNQWELLSESVEEDGSVVITISV